MSIRIYLDFDGVVNIFDKTLSSTTEKTLVM